MQPDSIFMQILDRSTRSSKPIFLRGEIRMKKVKAIQFDGRCSSSTVNVCSELFKQQ